jgi:hypothetical protein
MSAADPFGLRDYPGENRPAANPHVYEGVAVSQQNTSITGEYSQPGGNSPVSANVLSAQM